MWSHLRTTLGVAPNGTATRRTMDAVAAPGDSKAPLLSSTRSDEETVDDKNVSNVSHSGKGYGAVDDADGGGGDGGRGLHSFTSQLNMSAVYGIGGARRGCVAHVKGVLGGVKGVWGVFVC